MEIILNPDTGFTSLPAIRTWIHPFNPTSNLFQTFKMWDTFFYRGAFALSLVPGMFGLSAMIRPEATLKMIEFPVPTEPQSRKLAMSLSRLHGARNIVISYLFVNNALSGDRRLMGMGMIGTLFMLLVDGFVSRSLIGGKEWFHWGYIPVYVAFIGGLLYSE
jgi:hypothetical protein